MNKKLVTSLIVLLALIVFINCQNDTDVTIPTNTTTTAIPIAPPQQSETEESLDYLYMISTLFLTIFLTFFFHKFNIKYLPESVVTIFVGAVLGAILVIQGRKVIEFKLNSNTFYLLLLPPIIFESGYNLKKKDFFINFGSILSYAVIGTLISTIVIGLGLTITLRLPPLDSFVFASLISATDPVAVVAVMQGANVDTTLKALVCGESVLNDAVAIVLFRTFVESYEETAKHSLFGVIGSFIITFFGSIIIGAVTGFMTSLVFKHLNFKKTPALEFSFLMITCYTTFLIGEGLEMSGILAILTNGIVTSHYTHYNLSSSSKTAAHLCFKTMAFVCETIVFVYLGLAIFTFHHEFDFFLILLSVILIFLGRAANVFSVSYVLNHINTSPLSFKTQFVMFFSGLRGAIAFSLSLTTVKNDNHNKIITTTLFICLFTTIILGGGTTPLLKYLYNDLDIEDNSAENVDAELTEITPQLNGLNLLATVDDQYVQPFFRSQIQSPMVPSPRTMYSEVKEQESSSDDDDKDEKISIKITDTSRVNLD
ncbi:vacuolar protein sorting protein VPS44 [Acrasis kona]|uniref:Sodium/hydrogen exchanger n=1 Tax=Acrasis kona TaxID=1008807 RepID=A0AAW2ZHC5_9EUKA